MTHLALTLVAASAALLPEVIVPLRAAESIGRIGATAPKMALEPRRGWRHRLQSGSTAVAAAALVMLPRGPAQAAELGDANGRPSVSRDVGSRRSKQRRLQPAYLGFGNKKKYLEPPLDRSQLPSRSNQIDLDELVPPRMRKRFTERDFIFSDSLTYKGELAEELAELDMIKEDKKGARLASTITTTGGAVGLVYLSVKGLTGIERWMKGLELKEIEAEKELTGQYISVDAGDVDTSIDPLTGKNLTITKAPKAQKPTGDAAAEAAPTGPIAKLLGFLGLGETPADDDDGFWTGPAPTEPKQPKDGGSSSADDSGSTTAADGSGADGSDGMEDDTSNIDGLDDLLG